MALPQYKLGDQVFITLSRPSAKAKMQMEVAARTGVDGVEVWLTGKRGMPFEAFSLVDCADLDEAMDKLRRYEEMVGEDPIKMVWADIPDDFKVQVLDVNPVEGFPRTIVLGGGGTLGVSYAKLACVWTLIAV